MSPSNKTIEIQTRSLKALLQLFEEDAVLENLELGDTLHPFSGYVDEKLLKPNPSVKEVLRHAYDFRGLVVFKAKIGVLSIKMISDSSAKAYAFQVQGPFKTMVHLEHLLIEKNAYEPGKYKTI